MYFITTVGEDDTRCVGYFHDIDRALDVVRNNRYDLWEAGCYPWAVIEWIPEGVYQYDYEPQWFEYDEETNTYIERDNRPPFTMDNSVGYAMG